MGLAAAIAAAEAGDDKLKAPPQLLSQRALQLPFCFYDEGAL
jgi:hypothetical protein